MKLNAAIAERLDSDDYPVQQAMDFLQKQLDSGVLEGINEGAVCALRDALVAREKWIEWLEDHLIKIELDGTDHLACQHARDALNPKC